MTETPVAGDLRTFPYRWYTDARVAEIERDTIFRRTWQYAGHLGELAGPGSLFPTHAGGLYVRERVEPVLDLSDRSPPAHAAITRGQHQARFAAQFCVA